MKLVPESRTQTQDHGASASQPHATALSPGGHFLSALYVLWGWMLWDPLGWGGWGLIPATGGGKPDYLGPLGTTSVEAELLIGSSRVEKAM